VQAASDTYVERTIRTLELACAGPLSAAQVADALLVDVRTARRLLNRMVDNEILTVSASARPRYTAGPRLCRLATSITASPPFNN
jgi:DNA-binding IclR family transcriptional regulator